MILFVAPNPSKVKEREGFLQRVAAVDAIFDDKEKIYFEDIRQEDVARIVQQADLIYVHSIYQSSSILSLYPIFGEKIVTDLHGVVPEEELYYGRQAKSKELGEVEEQVFRFGKSFVAVTDAMVDHFQNKYPLSRDANWVVLPIFDAHIKSKKFDKSHLHYIVYAGGTQPWQKVDLMVDVINRSPDKYKYTILTHDPAGFSGIDDIVRKRVTISTVASSDVFSYYIRAGLGFALRDNSIVNKVACPTKIIEYLSGGVVPVVDYVDIGDFHAMGYGYVLYQDLLSGELKNEQLREAVKKNYEVLRKLKDKTRKGTLEIQALKANFEKNKKNPDINTSIIQSAVDNMMLRSELIKQQDRLNVLEDVINEKDEHIRHLEKKYETVIRSKRWRIASRAAKSSSVINKLYKKS